ncbi:radical SAM protein [Rhodovulum sulfidophilum]|nr:radical SAM protein [Rhodovulum sulfidophilum]
MEDAYSGIVLMRAPLRWIILKIHQRCNLNCSYCYVYNRGDDSWKSRPKQMGDAVIDRVCHLIVDHCATYAIDEFVIELHGGEPLLVGKSRLIEIMDRIRGTCAPLPIKFLLQTNGTLLDQEWCDIFAEYGVAVGVSVDGPAEFADLKRFYLDGRGSTDEVLRRLSSVKSHPDRPFTHGCLAVIDPTIPGNRMIDWLVENDILYADLLLPLGNRANPPDGWIGPEPYTAYMLDAFERWWALDGDAPHIRIFEMMIRAHLGHKPELDALGGDLGALCVVETNGAIGISDVISVCGGYDGTDLINVWDTKLDQHVDKLDVDLVQDPCITCKSCPEFSACNGGYLPHRWDGTGFDNTSLYCETLFALSARIREAIASALPANMIKTKEVAT